MKQFALILTLALAVILGAATASAQATRPAHPIISLHIIGWSDDSPATRNVRRALLDGGWKGFVQREIEPLIAAGVTRFHLHNPFGALAEPFMQLTQYEQAKAAKLDWLTDDFAEAWRPVTDRGIEVIAYVGSGRGDRMLARTKTRYGRVDCTWRNLKPFLDANASIAFDAGATAKLDSEIHGVIRTLRGMGVPVYIEAVAEHEHLTDLPAIFTDRYWTDPLRPTWGIHPSTVEMIRMCPDSAPTVELLRECRAVGHTLLAGLTVDVARELLASE